MFNTQYWNQRANMFGHTGHSEPFYYCFDQQARLFAINNIIKNLEINRNSALDFGCGSGDFITLLLKNNFKKVYAFDISNIVIAKAKKIFNQPSVLFLDDVNSILNTKYDLILTVTVLQTLTTPQLENTLNDFSTVLAPNGVIVCMEFFTSSRLNKQHNEDKVTDNEWLNVLKQHQFEIVTTYPFYNPHLAPNNSWKSYNSNTLLKLLKTLKHLSIIKQIFKQTALKLITKHNDVLIDKSPFHITIIKNKS